MTDAPELLPCPFCGEALVQNVAGGHWAHDAQSNGSCILSSMGVTDPAKWNTRAPPTLAEVADALISARRDLEMTATITGLDFPATLAKIETALANLKGPTP
jgi:hypothetical protein